jgi:hypothetical protein
MNCYIIYVVYKRGIFSTILIDVNNIALAKKVLSSRLWYSLLFINALT